MACPYCGSSDDWYKLDDGRSRCPGCYATTDANDAKAAKEQEAKDSTDKATTTPPLIADDVAAKATEAPKPRKGPREGDRVTAPLGKGKATEAPKPASKDVKGK